MIKILKDVKIYDNREDSQIWLRKGSYNNIDSFILEQIEPDYPNEAPNKFRPNSTGITSNGNILIAWDEEWGILDRREYINE